MTICDGDMAARLSQATFSDISDEYREFEKKFSRRVKTTDDCYTPPKVYDVVLAWVRSRYQIADDTPIVRPFYPGGNYEAYDYPAGCVVVDNPPFSCLQRIIRFYARRKIKFFLFAPCLMALRCCHRDLVCGVVVASGARIVYQNGADVRTAFCTNLTDCILEVAPELGRAIKSATSNSARAVVRRSVAWPDGAICSSASLDSIRVPFRIPFRDAVSVEKLDNYGKIFGGGLLLSPEASKKVRLAREKSDAVERVELSAREIAVQKKIVDDWEKSHERNQDD